MELSVCKMSRVAGKTGSAVRKQEVIIVGIKVYFPIEDFFTTKACVAQSLHEEI